MISNGVLNSSAGEVLSTTWPLPPVPVATGYTNTTLVITVPLNQTHEPLETVSVEVCYRISGPLLKNGEVNIGRDRSNVQACVDTLTKGMRAVLHTNSPEPKVKNLNTSWWTYTQKKATEAILGVRDKEKQNSLI